MAAARPRFRRSWPAVPSDVTKLSFECRPPWDSSLLPTPPGYVCIVRQSRRHFSRCSRRVAGAIVRLVLQRHTDIDASLCVQLTAASARALLNDSSIDGEWLQDHLALVSVFYNTLALSSSETTASYPFTSLLSAFPLMCCTRAPRAFTCACAVCVHTQATWVVSWACLPACPSSLCSSLWKLACALACGGSAWRRCRRTRTWRV